MCFGMCIVHIRSITYVATITRTVCQLGKKCKSNYFSIRFVFVMFGCCTFSLMPWFDAAAESRTDALNRTDAESNQIAMCWHSSVSCDLIFIASFTVCSIHAERAINRLRKTRASTTKKRYKASNYKSVVQSIQVAKTKIVWKKLNCDIDLLWILSALEVRLVEHRKCSI